MKAARWHGVKDIRVEDIAEPSPAAGEVKVKVAWAGICGSDLHEYLAGGSPPTTSWPRGSTRFLPRNPM